MKIYICDDEPKILSDISLKVKSEFADAVVSEFASGKSLLEVISESRCDILLLDIDMPEISGLDIAAKLSSMAEKPLLVFVTSHDELVYGQLSVSSFWLCT